MDPLKEFLNGLQSLADQQWPQHRNALRDLAARANVPVDVPDRFIVPGAQERGQAQAPKPAGPFSDGDIPLGERILAAAVIHRGKPYVWGGDTYNTFDCSALTQRAARDNGIAIGRTTYQQIENGTEIPWGQQQIGDLIFSRFSAPSVPEHVSIWAGNGKVFEAGDPLDYYIWGSRGTVRVRRLSK